MAKTKIGLVNWYVSATTKNQTQKIDLNDDD